MKILAHRGLWSTPEQKNSLPALVQALEAGWGVETDIRDLAGELVISHDAPQLGAISVKTLFEEYRRIKSSSPLALNIKSDGLSHLIKSRLFEYSIDNYFCFDMSVPDTLQYLEQGVNTAARISEYEHEGLLTEAASVIWLDGFMDNTVDPHDLSRWLSAGKMVCLVSPELHRRSPDFYWNMLTSLPSEIKSSPDIMLCTDYPQKAMEIFQ